METSQSAPDPPPARPRAFSLRTEDAAWLLFVIILIVTAPETSYQALIILPIIGALQILEPRFRVFDSRRGQIVSIALKLILGYLLVGWTHGAESYYYSIFLIPVVSAATIFEFRGVLITTGIAAIAYFTFLLPFYLDPYVLPPEQITLMFLRAAFYAIVAFLVYEQAKGKREEMARTEEAAARLAESNRRLRETQVSLRRSERLAALGQLTAGLAHELRNPLGTIKASAEMLQKPAMKNRPELMDEMAGYILSEADRMNGLVASFLDFARPLSIHPEEAELTPLLEGVLREQSELARAGEVTLRLASNCDGCRFRFDPALLRLALSNLVQNAIQASDKGQRVDFGAQANPEQVRLFVEDQGAGIKPEHLENIFNPFFTTKAKGVGLGLAIVSKIVDEHQGRIDVKSETGKGTRFDIRLPRT
jgi:two-component system, NtrC family, sensor histidine kinase HydH